MLYYIFQFSGIKLCLGNPVDYELLDLMRSEVGDLQESVKLFTEESTIEKVLIIAIN